MPEMAQTNPFEANPDFRFDRKLAVKNHGGDVMVHLGVGTGDCEEVLEMILDHNEKFENWLEANNREAFMVPEESIGLRCDGHKMVGTGYAVISKIRDWETVVE